MQGCTDGRKEAEGRGLDSAPAPSLGSRVNNYWKGQNSTFLALQMEMPVVTARFQGGSVDMSCEDTAPQREAWPARELKREAECGSSWL